jgi:pyruvate dehydrogenase E2 component (dihydrolipoamide acetyltransferase)
MATDVTMPRLSDSMEEGTIIRWLKADGDEVTRGEEIAEIETDKATMSYEADADGTLRIVAQEGDTLPVGEVIARLGGETEEPAGDAGGQETATGANVQRDEGPESTSEETGEPDREAAGVATRDEEATASRPQRTQQAPSRPASPAGGGGGGADGAGNGRVKASPVARRMARELGVELGALQGSGPEGRIVKADVEAAAQPAPAASGEGDAEELATAPASEPVERGTAKGEVSAQELSRVQQLIARRMAESRATVPDFWIEGEIDMEEVAALREQLRAVAGEDGVTPSFNDFVVKACALALRAHPRVNASYRDGAFELHGRINIGIAVAAQESLLVPTIFDADQKALGEIARLARELAAKGRDARLSAPELGGGTFSISNLGGYGTPRFQAVINPPQAAILAVAAIRKVPVVLDDRVVVRRRMSVTLSCDHRILYGADAAAFLTTLRELLEQPLRLAL